MSNSGSSSDRANEDDSSSEMIDLVIEATLERMQRGEIIDLDEINRKHPHLQPELENRLFTLHHVFELVRHREHSRTARSSVVRAPDFDGFPAEYQTDFCCPHCGAGVQVVDQNYEEITCRTCGSSIQITPPHTKRSHGSFALTYKQLGRFVLREIVGRGGFGVVYKAFDTELKRIVAVKLPRAGYFGTEEEEQRFLREARHVARLNHPNIVPVYEIGREEGSPFLVSEFIDGMTLGDLIAHRRLEFKDSAELLAKVADAIGYAHEQKIIHRDLKPGNILLNHDHEPFVTDFGLARADEGEFTITIHGQVIGTPSYMSPEQVKGDPSKIGPLADVYALGVVLYRMLTGELPFRGGKRLLMHQIQHEEPPTPRSVNEFIPRDLETITLKAMSKEPAKRYASARDLANDLRNVVQGVEISARPVSRWEKFHRVCRRYPVASSLAFTVAALLLITAIGGGVWALRESGLRRNVQTALADLDAEQVRSRRQLARFLVPVGNEHLLKGDNLSSLPFLVEGWAMETDGDRISRLRIGSVLSECPGLISVQARAGVATASEFSLDNSVAACGYQDGTVVAWQVDTEQIVVESSEQDEITDLAISSSGQYLAAASADHSIFVWNLQTGVLVGRNTDHKDRVKRVIFVADTGQLLTASTDGTARLWDFTSDQRVATFEHEHALHELALSLDNQYFFTTSWDVHDNPAKLTRWKIDDPSSPAGVYQHEKAIESISLDRSGGFMLSRTSQDEILIWNLGQAGLDPVHTTVVERNCKFARLLGDISPEGVGEFLSVSLDGRIRTRSWPDDKIRFASDTGKRVTCVALDASEQSVAIGDQTNRCTVWKLDEQATRSPPLVHANQIGSVLFSNNGRYVLTQGDDGFVKIWDISMRRRRFDSIPCQVHPQISLGPGEELLAIVTSYTDIQILSTRDGSVVTTIKHPPNLQTIDFSPNESELITGCTDGIVRIWNARNGELISQDLVAGDPVWHVNYSPNGETIVGAALENIPVDRTRKRLIGIARVHVWDRSTLKEIGTLSHDNHVSKSEFSPDGKLLATICHDQSVRVWDLQTCQPVSSRIRDGAGYINDVKFSEDGNHLLIAGENIGVDVWDFRGNERILGPLKHHANAARAIYNPLDSSLVTASHEGKAFFWSNTLQPQRLRTISTYGVKFKNLEFSDDGDFLFTTTAPPSEIPKDRKLAGGACQIWGSSNGEMVGPLFVTGRSITNSVFAKKDMTLVVAATRHEVFMWWLTSDIRPLDTLRDLAEVLSGHRVDDRRSYVPLSAAGFMERWSRLRNRHPETSPSSFSPGFDN